MPYSTTWERHGIVWAFGGDVTAREIEQANETFYNDPRSERARYQIIDARHVRSVEWKERDIKVTAAYDIGADRLIRNLKVAYVARDEDVVAKMERYVDLARRLNSSWQFRGFHGLEDARAWVGA